jgi:hypothetical protein
MPLVKQAHRDHSQTRSPFQSAPEAEPERDLEDFERDELLRTLRLEDWFATAAQGVPIWCL